MPAYRFVDTDAALSITVDGVPLHVAADRSLLASLLAAAGAGIGFACAIGQCQRCLVQVDGVARLACLYYPAGGERVETVRAFEPRHNDD